MPEKWDGRDTFHIGINMAGAVSAGAYTAGVLDFFMEALEQWYAVKAAGNPAVPQHDVSIDVFSGASAGGMCAAIAAVMVQGDFQHIDKPSDPAVANTTNKFYESWVNKIDIQPLLQADDLANGKPVISLLDSTIIDQIADYAIVPVAGVARPYISKSLTLFLTVTNVRGVPFSLNGNAPGSAEEDIAYFADRLQFETVNGGPPIESPVAWPLPIGQNGGSWALLKEAAKATGAFPIFLAPRQLDRVAREYTGAPWGPISAPPDLVPPHWPLQETDAFRTLNVDGGVTDNDPFELAHDFLAVHNPLAGVDAGTGELRNPSGADQANCAVLTVAPFPAYALYDAKYDFAGNSGVMGMLPNLFNVLISQSRFSGETLDAVMSGESFSRFVLAPSDADNPNKAALQCGSLGAFGGFFERGFRAHDYQLGRRNCQKFLRDCFRLAESNPIIAGGLNHLDAASRAKVAADFGSVQNGVATMPVIPLCGSAVAEVPSPARAAITQARLDNVVKWSVNRLQAVAKRLLAAALGSSVENVAVREAADLLIATWGKSKLKQALQKELGDVISG
ncbi:MAG TPA: patatin-like phospholipase family protein [Verrucomicrobiae bacterium]|nr:patatin-like phospholipase family protein [Verrucomicrobiae bacterium]